MKVVTTELLENGILLEPSHPMMQTRPGDHGELSGG